MMKSTWQVGLSRRNGGLADWRAPSVRGRADPARAGDRPARRAARRRRAADTRPGAVRPEPLLVRRRELVVVARCNAPVPTMHQDARPAIEAAAAIGFRC